MQDFSQKQNPSHHVLPTLPLVVVAMLFAGVARGVAANNGTPMFVRAWDPGSGTLVGWLPTHSLAIRLEILNKSQAPQFAANETVTVRWVPHPGFSLSSSHLFVTPEPRVFEGESWIPVQRAANIVRVQKSFFLIREIIFGNSKWRQATQVATTRRSFGGE